MSDAASRSASWAAERVARDSYGKLIAILAAQDRDIAAAEDALSEAFAAALRAWPVKGVPSNPVGWLVTTARNTRRNAARGEGVRKAAEPEILRRIEEGQDGAPVTSLSDERLRLMFACAHPAIDPGARTPLILQSVLGIDAARIARAFLVPSATMSQRLVRAKARIRDTGLAFALPEAEDLAPRLEEVLEAIYAAFGTGWDGLDTPNDPEALSGEAIWLARLIVEQLPKEPEPKGLLALMLYCTARREARRDADGRFVPLDQQDSRLWDRSMVIEAEGLLTHAAQSGRFGRFQCEAAIQSVHIQRPITGRLNLDALLVLYDLLVDLTGSLGAHIGRAVVLAEKGDLASATMALDALPQDRVAGHQPWWVARARVAALAGHPAVQRDALRRAIELTEEAGLHSFLTDQYVALV